MKTKNIDHYDNRQRGFSFIEMVITITIMALVAGIVSPLLYLAIAGIGNPVDRADLEETRNLVFSRMTREIRALWDDTSVITSTSTIYEFNTCLVSTNPPCSQSGGSTRIRYRQVGNSLMRRVAAGTERILANNLQANTLKFTYYDDNGTVVNPANGGNIKMIRVSFTLQSGTQVKPIWFKIVQRNVHHAASTLP